MLELQNVSKFYYSDSSVTVALKKINLKLPDAGLVAITGESGSGKTTLLNVISGELNYDEGEMLINGEPTFQYSEEEWEQYRKEKIGFVYQDYSLLMDYTVLDNVVSVMVILNVDMETAGEKALYYLEKVGLKELASKKAKELSSGQKQRLSIARALAKETDIIVADEPTGNLDSETGEQIIRLLKELASDRLVVLVTHNYKQAEAYVDRKIRIFDGEIADDVTIKKEKEKTSHKKKQQADEDVKQDKKDTNVIKYFVKKNIFAKKGKLIFYQFFFLLVATVSFVFLGDFLTRLDEAHSMKYNPKYFANDDETRLLVQRMDGAEITYDDLKKIQNLKDVVSVDRYDYVQDINYYAVLGEDYKQNIVIENVFDEEWDEEQEKTFYVPRDVEVEIPEFLDKTHFMRSVSALAGEKLADGELPCNLFDIVVSRDYGLNVGDKLTIYLTADNAWGKSEYYCKEFTVSGITEKKDCQIYFSDKFCQMIGAAVEGFGVTAYYEFDVYTIAPKNYQSFYLVMTDEFADCDYSYPYGKHIGFSPDEYNFEGLVVLSHMSLYTDNYYYGAFDEPYGMLNAAIRPCTMLKYKDVEAYMDVAYDDMAGGMTKSSISFLEVSEELFHKFYDKESTQATAYINNYARTDKVIKLLNDKGYKAVSSYRLGREEYDDQMVYDRFTGIIVALVILVVLVLFEVLVLGFAMRINRRDYMIMRSIGMERKNVKKLVYYELLVYCVNSVVFIVVLSTVMMQLFKGGILDKGAPAVSYISNLLYYFTLPSMIFYLVYNLLAQWLTSLFVNLFVNGGKKA